MSLFARPRPTLSPGGASFPDHKLNPELLLARLADLPAMPEAVVRLLTTLDAASSSANDVARVVQSDQGLSIKVLRLANSAAMGTCEPIANLRRATVLLGFETIRAMALSYGLCATVSGSARTPWHAQYWAHAVAAGIAANALARHARWTEPADAFALGLLHDVGQSILAHFAPDSYAQILTTHSNTHLPIPLLEFETFGFTHATVGALFLRHWGLPDPIALAVEHHHTVYAVSGAKRVYPALAELADTACYHAGFSGLSGPDPDRPWRAGHARLLRIRESDLDPVTYECRLRVDELAALLNLPRPIAHPEAA